MGDALFTNPTGAFGLEVDGNALGRIFAPFKVAESSSGAVTVGLGQICQITTTATVLGVDTAQTDNILGVALQAVTVPDTDLAAASGQYTGPRNVDIVLFGMAEVLSGGTSQAFNATLGSNASGQAIASTIADNNWILGYAIEATGASAGALVTCRVAPGKLELS